MSNPRDIPRGMEYVIGKPRLRKIKVVPKESQEQIRLVIWMQKRNILFFMVPNAGRRGQAEGMHLKRQGMQAGVPDLIIPMARGKYHGMAIEMKRQVGGVMKENQRYWQEALTNQGWLAVVCKGADEAIALVEKYMALAPGASIDG